MPQKLRWDRVACRKCGHGIPILFRKCPSCKYVYFGDELTELKSSKKGLIRLTYWIYGGFVACLIGVSLISTFVDGSGSEEEKREAAIEVVKAVFRHTSTCNKADLALYKSVINSMKDPSDEVSRSQLATDIEALWQACLHTGSDLANIPISSTLGEKLVPQLTSARNTCADAYLKERAIAHFLRKHLENEPTPENILAIDPNFDKESLHWAYSIPYDKATASIKKCYRELNAATLQVGVDIRQASKDFDAIYIGKP